MFFSDFALKSIEMANKTKSIYYTRQFVNMYSETVFINWILFNRRSFIIIKRFICPSEEFLFELNMERLTLDSLKSEFMEPEFTEPYDLILMILYDGSHCEIKFTMCNQTRPRSIFAPSTILTSA